MAPIPTKLLKAHRCSLLLLPIFFLTSFFVSLLNTAKPLTSAKHHINLYNLQCKPTNETQKCPNNLPQHIQFQKLNPATCPDYFRWIHEDLRPWTATGITREMVDNAQATAHLRLVIVGGRMFVKNYKPSIQSRAKFTVWGILQLLRMYPGSVPDLELLFDCDDRPVVPSRDYPIAGNGSGPPPVFRYCSDRKSLDIVFPDWSFWGWPEINIKPWQQLLKELKQGNSQTRWLDREPYAYWKGNPFVAETRQDLLTCNLSRDHDWNARLFVQVILPYFTLLLFIPLSNHAQDWIQESQQGFKLSNVANQCKHRYKIYIEGYAWSVSEKYILACDAVTLLVKPYFHDFFTRSLRPLKHFWPIRDTGKCKSIKFAVDWGNAHPKEAEEIGKEGSDFLQEQLTMENVYSYMYHLLHGYAKLQRFKPRVPEGAWMACAETTACEARGFEKILMGETLVSGPAVSPPCELPPPYERRVLDKFHRDNLNAVRRVQKWEDAYFSSH